jgi:hypothetical protein
MANTVVEIDTAQEYVDFVTVAQTNIDVCITADLDFSNIEPFTPVDSTSVNVYGNNHIISNYVGNQILGRVNSVNDLVINNCHITVTNYFLRANSLNNILVKNNCTIVIKSNTSVFYSLNSIKVRLNGVVFIEDLSKEFYIFYKEHNNGGSPSTIIQHIQLCYCKIIMKILNTNTGGKIIFARNAVIQESFMRLAIDNVNNNMFTGVNIIPLYMDSYYQMTGNATNKIIDSYIVVTAINNTNNIENIQFYGIHKSTYSTNPYQISKTFFDEEASSGMTLVSDSEYGETTAHLQSADWLREQGWVI